MFDVGFDEMLVIAVIAIIVIGPKDLPRALRTLGRWVARVRRMSAHFRAGMENMIREAELEDMEQKWREQNEAILKAHPALPADSSAETGAESGASLPPPATKAEAIARQSIARQGEADADQASPQLPLPPP